LVKIIFQIVFSFLINNQRSNMVT